MGDSWRKRKALNTQHREGLLLNTHPLPRCLLATLQSKEPYTGRRRNILEQEQQEAPVAYFRKLAGIPSSIPSWWQHVWRTPWHRQSGESEVKQLFMWRPGEVLSCFALLIPELHGCQRTCSPALPAKKINLFLLRRHSS